MKCEPKFGRVLIEREIKEKTAGGIIIPNAKRHASCTGKIVSLGETAGWVTSYNDDGEPNPKQIFNVGDKVIFGRYAGTWIDATYNDKGEANDDGKLFICQDEDILATVKE